jgi:glycosyltransferase involved in cell wall biosynthesis
MSMHAAIIDGDVSYPATSGKRLRTLNLMLRLAGRHRITYLARGQGDLAQNREATAFLRDHGIDARIVDDPLPPKKGAAFCARLAANLLSPLPYSVASHRSEKFRAAVAELAARDRVDLFQLEWTGYLHTLPSPSAPAVVQAHNVDSLLWQRYHQAETRALARWYIAAQWRKFLRFERQAFRAARAVVAVSVEDAALAREWFGVEHIDVVDNGVDVAHFRSVRPQPASRTILYLGALDWRPNLDALDLLLDAIFPAVAALVPGARLVVVGRSPPDRLRRRVAAVPGAELHADVPDVRPYLGASAVMAVPLRIGGGSRLKILEALASGLPVVSTRVGAEGLAVRPGHDFTLADSPSEMTGALVRCLTRPEEAVAQAERGRQTVAGRYDWSSLADRLERVWEKAHRSAECGVPSAE